MASSGSPGSLLDQLKSKVESAVERITQLKEQNVSLQADISSTGSEKNKIIQQLKSDLNNAKAEAATESNNVKAAVAAKKLLDEANQNCLVLADGLTKQTKECNASALQRDVIITQIENKLVTLMTDSLFN